MKTQPEKDSSVEKKDALGPQPTGRKPHSLESADTKDALLLAASTAAAAAGTEEVSVTTEIEPLPALRYSLTQIPPIPVALCLAIQHVLTTLASALTTSSIIADTLCADLDHAIRAQLFATTLFMGGICTVVQTLVGVRLPVFQGPSSSFLVPLIALGKNPGWICSAPITEAVNYSEPLNGTMSLVTMTNTVEIQSLTLEQKLQQLSGSLMIASLVEVIVGGLGLLKPLLHFIGPLTVAPTIGLIGLSLFKLPVIYARYNPPICLGSALLVIVFSLYMTNVKIPLPSCTKGGKRGSFPLFQLLPILVAMVLMWMLCGVLTVTGAIPDDPKHPSYYARTDAKANILRNTPWFHFTYPGQFGYPSFNVAATLGFSAAVISSLIESVGDYYAAARCCQVTPPPDHAMSRGILMEGLGSVFSGAVGAAHATTSYSGNIAMLGLTQTASRSVLVIAGIMLMLLSVFGKVGAAMATLPPPILGGILWVVLGLLSTLGISTLKYADMTTNRNLLVTGMAFMSGLSVPAFLEEHGDMLNTGYQNLDQVIRVVLGTPMFLGGAIALILDNTVPGTDLERGLISWKTSHSGGKEGHSKQNGATSGNKEDRMALEDLQTSQVDGKGSEREGCLAFSEDEIYGFTFLRNRLSSRLWRFVSFLPPSAIKSHVPSDVM